jgi:four helix bundle protein
LTLLTAVPSRARNACWDVGIAVSAIAGRAQSAPFASEPLTAEATMPSAMAVGDGIVRALAIWMAKEIDERAFALGLRVITLRRDEEYQRIVRWKVIGQLVDAATSVGANLSEASAAQSKPDFVAKVSVAKKEAFETQFWLRLIDEAKVLGTSTCRNSDPKHLRWGASFRRLLDAQSNPDGGGLLTPDLPSRHPASGVRRQASGVRRQALGITRIPTPLPPRRARGRRRELARSV